MPSVNFIDVVSPAATFAVFAVSSMSVFSVGVVSVGSGETFSSVLHGEVLPVMISGVFLALCDTSAESDSSGDGTVVVVSEATDVVES